MLLLGNKESCRMRFDCFGLVSLLTKVNCKLKEPGHKNYNADNRS